MINMTNFLKCTLATGLTMFCTVAGAQDLSRNIPADALAVVTVKGGNLTELMAIKDFDTTFIGKEIISKLSKESNGSFKSIDDIGLDLSANFYYYHQSNDSVSYNCFLAPVKNAGKLDQIFSLSGKKFNTNGSLRTSFESDSTNITYWNEKFLLFVAAEGKSSYFALPDVSSRLGLQSYPGLPGTEVTIDSTTTVDDTEMDDVVEVVVAPPPPPPARKIPSVKNKKGKASNKQKGKGKGVHKTTPKKKVAPVVEVPVVEEVVEEYPVAEEVVADTAYAADEQYSGYNNAYFENEKIKKGIVGRWAAAMVAERFERNDLPSITGNKDFVKNIDNSAEVSVWIPGLNKLTEAYMPTNYFKGMDFFSGYGSLNFKIFLEEKTIRTSAGLVVNDEMVTAVKKIHKRKLNKKFLNYVNEDKMIGYIGYAVDTKAYLQEYPKLISKVYGSLFKDEVEMATDLFSLLLDEEAIGKVVKGDALFVFNGLSSKEVSYKAYDYNEENFETTEVTKTKQETLPDFLFMYSSDDTRLTEKLIAYGVKKEMVKSKNTYYELSIPKSPLALYFTIKDGIVFMGTDEAQMSQIGSNTYQSKINAIDKKTLLASNFSGYFSPKKLDARLPAGIFGQAQDKTQKTLRSLGDIRLKSNKINGNLVSGEMSMDIPAGQPNALRYLFDVISTSLK